MSPLPPLRVYEKETPVPGAVCVRTYSRDPLPQSAVFAIASYTQKRKAESLRLENPFVS